MFPKRIARLIFTAALIVSSNAFTAETSPFADKPCKSYSSYRGEDGKQVDPLWGTARISDFGSREVKFDQAGRSRIAHIRYD